MWDSSACKGSRDYQLKPSVFPPLLSLVPRDALRGNHGIEGWSADIVKCPDKGASNLNRHSLLISHCALSHHLRIISGESQAPSRLTSTIYLNILARALAPRCHGGVPAIAHAASYETVRYDYIDGSYVYWYNPQKAKNFFRIICI
jgi:hypothetical protein